ncbi:MAG TPA: hypothetical protein VLS90_02415 [Thermodesulfobacteriota bacterium]|nr:hypothetical protein [Thermodesulfobacteriota bacterium]
MLAISILAARWVIDFLALPPRLPARIGMGLIALALMLAAETGLVLRMRRLSLRGYLETRDRVSGAVYYALLVVFALLPTFIGT